MTLRRLIWFIVSLLLLNGFNAVEKCDVTIDISSGTIQSNGDYLHNNVRYSAADYFQNASGVFGCACHVLSCVNECCDSHQTIDLTSGSVQCVSNQHRATTGNGSKPALFNIIRVPNKPVCEEKTIVLDFSIEEYLSMLVNREYLDLDSYQFHYSNYCIVTDDENTVTTVICIGPTRTVNTYLYVMGMIISMPFLLVTFLVYLILPEKNVHQKALMFYVLSLLLGYILLVTINLSESLVGGLCKTVGYLTVFFFMISFFWMNVICFDIWYTFSGGRGYIGSKKNSETRRFLMYSAYAVGLPALMVLVVFGVDRLDIDERHKPNVGVRKCFIDDGWPQFWYLYLEAGILVIANITFFTLTALKIRQVKRETLMLKQSESKRHTYEKDKQRFNLFLKLLLAMGVNWSMEVISWLVNWLTQDTVQYIWYLTDFVNAAYGVIIFFIFVFKKKIWRLLKKRYYNFIGKPNLARAVTTTDTRTSHYSSTNYSTADTHLTERSVLSERPTVNNGLRSEETPLQRA